MSTGKSIQSLAPNILTDDMAGSIEFYRELLGFQIVAKVPDEPPYGWVMFVRDGVTIMLQSRASLGEDMGLFRDEEIGGTLVFFCKVQDIDAWWRSIGDKAPIFMPPRETFYGMREFGFLDNNGYRFVFAQDV